MNAESQTAPLFAREQFRMCQLQVFNWGTFKDLHDIPIAERGFLFVGRSGAGKSTLLDAFSALLVPPRWVDFNAAAREADRSGRDRNLVTYVRGAWAEQKDDASGEIATRYLRSGTTWSALALSYKNAMEQSVVLVQLFWIRGNGNGPTDVRRHYLIFERPFDLRELESFGEWNFDIRKLKHTFSDAYSREEFRPYSERFCRLLGIESEMALRLLHKTQSAKNLGDLNTFLRDFMLDKPETFKVADRLVSEFGELNAAHQTVVTAREQIQMLAPAREQHQRMQEQQYLKNILDELLSGIDGYKESCRKVLLAEHIESLTIQAEGMQGELSRRKDALSHHETHLRELEQQHRDMGGANIEQWEKEKENLESQREERLRKYGQAETACRTLNWVLSATPQGFAELVGNARQEIEVWNRGSHTGREEQFRLAKLKNEAESEFTNARKEVLALQRQPSNIPADMLELRRNIAAAIGVAEDALPFVGELLEVKKEESPWQGAIERVLHGFALSLLVDERNYTALASHINSTPLGKRLVYYRIGKIDAWQPRPIGASSLIFKLNIKESAWTEWLQNELRQRFDYACVDSIQALRNADRAITQQGQVKHNKTRHEKDDRSAIHDRRNWVLGFNNHEKLQLFEQQIRELGEEISKLQKQISALSDQEINRATRAIQCQTLINLQWQEIDVAPLLYRIDVIEKQIREAKEGNTELQQISGRIERQRELVKNVGDELLDIRSKHQTILSDIEKSQLKLTELQQNPSFIPLTPTQKKGLDERFSNLSDIPSLDNIERLCNTIERSIRAEITDINGNIAECAKNIEKTFTEFKRQWSMDAGNMDTTLASAPDYFAKLARLESDGLPAYEERFFQLLQNQSNQNLASLSTYMADARKTILERMGLVNDSLREVPFNQSINQRTYLCIEATDRQLDDVREFKQDLQQVLSHAWSDDRQFAELRFVALRKLVTRLASQDPEDKKWRESILDVRQHVEFIGREIDEEDVEVEIYRSGAGKSGGQRQKLATTCLAAALRYQLGGNDYGLPMYAPVILDEAFDKADNEFTALAMNIFTNFGFQMIVATPLKSVMTLEPFIGGACFVDISDRRHSGILLIEYDTERQRLNLPVHAVEEEH